MTARQESDTYYITNYFNDIDTMFGEIWAPVPGYEKRYQVSNLGRIRRIFRKIHPTADVISSTYRVRLMRGSAVDSGYRAVELYSDSGESSQHLIHRLVASAFLPNPHNKPTVNHIDGVKWHNELSNLEWATTSEQQIHALAIGLRTRERTNSLEEIERAWRRSVEVRMRPVRCLEDDIVYRSVADAERAATGGYCNGNLSTALKRSHGVFRGKHYEYIEKLTEEA